MNIQPISLREKIFKMLLGATMLLYRLFITYTNNGYIFVCIFPITIYRYNFIFNYGHTCLKEIKFAVFFTMLTLGMSRVIFNGTKLIFVNGEL